MYFEKTKLKWIRSGKTSKNGNDACFEGRGKKQKSNARNKDQIGCAACIVGTRRGGLTVLEGQEGTFDNLVMYCGMANGKRGNTEPLTSVETTDSFYVWRKDIIDELT